MRRNYITVEQAIALPGLRIAFTRGVPGPWGEACRAIFDMKGIDYWPVIQEGGAPNEELRAWTGQNSAPCAVLDDERPRTIWSELLMLAERLNPEPRLVPLDEELRTEMFGVAHELCAEDGFGWSARILLFDIIEQQAGAMPGMRAKFTSGASVDHARGRAIAVLQSLGRRMERQQQAGSEYLVGPALTAADIYWTTFSNMVAPIPHEACPMPDHYRGWSEACIAALDIEVPTPLIAHRDRVLQRHFQLPMWF